MSAITFDYFVVMEIWEKIETISGEAVSSRKGKYMRVDSSTGKAVLGNGSTATEVGVLRGVAMSDAKFLGDPVTLLRYGLVDVGDELDALDFGDPVYISDTDGVFGNDAGDSAETAIGGRVWPMVEGDGTVLKKLLIDLR